MCAFNGEALKYISRRKCNQHGAEISEIARL